jgi:indole-3-glycerol phosphate synthase
MSTHLDKILATTRATVAASGRRRVSLAELERQAAEVRVRGWVRGVRGAKIPAIIAEIKKASPSKGLIRADFDVSWLARALPGGGAAALSVLTDEPYFQGSLRNLELASAAVNALSAQGLHGGRVPDCRGARALGGRDSADCGGADKRRAVAVLRKAHEYELDVLVEVHTEGELDRVLTPWGRRARMRSG